MSDEMPYPPTAVQLREWDNGGGVAVLCGGAQHRVVRQGNDIVARDHSGIALEVSAARAALDQGEIGLLGLRYVDTGFLLEDLERWRVGHTWTYIGPRRIAPEKVRQVADPALLAPCVRLVIEGYVPCNWCGNLLANGNTCLPSDNPTCALSSGNGWKKSIPPGWVQGTQIGSPFGLTTTGWPQDYRWIRNGPFTHHPQAFLASPWWPELHPRRLKNLVCQYAADHGVHYRQAFDDVALQLQNTLGPMKPPPRSSNSSRSDRPWVQLDTEIEPTR